MPRRRKGAFTLFLALLLLALLIFTAIRIFVVLQLTESNILSGDEVVQSSVEFQKEFILPKNEPLVELKLALAKKPKISPLLSNMRSIDESKLPYQC